MFAIYITKKAISLIDKEILKIKIRDRNREMKGQYREKEIAIVFKNIKRY